MRCYHLCNMYLAGIHAGIQSAHAQMELFVKYKFPSINDSVNNDKIMDYLSKEIVCATRSAKMLYEWAENYKTTICLNGGYQSVLEEFYDFLLINEGNNRYPFSMFRESKDALNGVLTNVAIVLPDYIYNVIPIINDCIFLVVPDTRINNQVAHKLVTSKHFKPDNDIFYTEFDKQLIMRLSKFSLMS